MQLRLDVPGEPVLKAAAQRPTQALAATDHPSPSRWSDSVRPSIKSLDLPPPDFIDRRALKHRMKPATQRVHAATACVVLLSQMAQTVAGKIPAVPAIDARLLIATAPVQSECELRLLNQLGWQQAYQASGYSIAAQLPPNCSTDTWQSLGCLHSLTNLTLSGSLPNLPGAWAANGSFPALEMLTFSGAELGGPLPDNWMQAGSFPQLMTLDLSSTQVSGTLPAGWGQGGAFSRLSALNLTNVSLSGEI